MNIEERIKTSVKLPENKKLLINLLMTTNEVSTTMALVVKPFGISMQQFNVLRILRGQKGKPANLSTIQDRMVSKMSNTTRLVDKLVEKDFVERQICEANRRKIEMFITKKGLALLEEIDPKVDKSEQSILQGLSSSEIKTLNNLLDKIRE
ncbi:MarR family winged helix-turn-helix transcriptional regulator [Mesonia aquimarina]|uniref:MarR family winged helix-turn-helix transcriptional regulator n=1 Tax=Mesonia aquimarina TaxID=1504967 RepID=UPI000EF5BA4E|nr:MarR family transcriptional regulator [Mesonia aquimarina]